MANKENVVDMVKSLSTQLGEAKAEADMWEAMAKRHRETVDKFKYTNDILRAQITAQQEEIKGLRKELDKTKDAYDIYFDLYHDMRMEREVKHYDLSNPHSNEWP